MEQTRRDIEAETRRAIQQIRAEVADLTVLATEKVTRKSLDSADQKRLVEEALAELDFAALAQRGAPLAMEEIAAVYARSLFEVAQEQDKLDLVRDQLGAFADALDETRELQVFFFSPYFSTPEKQDGLDRAVSDADPSRRQLPQAADREPPDAGHLPRPAGVRRAVARRRTSSCPVQVTSAVELDQATVEQIGDRIAEQTGRKVDLSASVEPDILGGIIVRVGNSVLDASIRNRLEQLRKQVARLTRR